MRDIVSHENEGSFSTLKEEANEISLTLIQDLIRLCLNPREKLQDSIVVKLPYLSNSD